MSDTPHAPTRLYWFLGSVGIQNTHSFVVYILTNKQVYFFALFLLEFSSNDDFFSNVIGNNITKESISMVELYDSDNFYYRCIDGLICCYWI